MTEESDFFDPEEEAEIKKIANDIRILTDKKASKEFKELPYWLF